MAVQTPPVDATVRLEPTPPFSFSQSLAFVDGFAPCADDRVCRDGTLTTGGHVGATPFVATLQVDEAAPSADGADALRVAIRWPTDHGDPDAVGRALRAYLSLDDELGPLYETAEADPAFGAVVDDLYGYHHVRFPTPFEAACWAALSQRTPWTDATNQKRAIVEAAGHVATVDGRDVACFPTPELVLRSRGAIAAAIDNDRKRRTIFGAAEAFVAEDLDALSEEPLCKRLAEIWGFGPWASEFVTLRGFGRLSRLPRTERRLREAVATLYDLDDEAASDAAMERLSAPYDPLGGYWAHYVRVWAERGGPP